MRRTCCFRPSCSVYAVVERPGMHFLDFGAVGDAVLQLNTGLKHVFLAGFQPRIYGDEVFLLMLEAGVGEVVGELAVVCQQQ